MGFCQSDGFARGDGVRELLNGVMLVEWKGGSSDDLMRYNN